MHRPLVLLILIAIATPALANLYDREIQTNHLALARDYNPPLQTVEPNEYSELDSTQVRVGLILGTLSLFLFFSHSGVPKVPRRRRVTFAQLFIALMLIGLAIYFGFWFEERRVKNIEKQREDERYGNYELMTISLPYHQAKYANDPSFRFVIVHDTIPERYAKHSRAYYLERERKSKEKLSTIAADSAEAFELIDDIAVSLDRTGRSEEAIAIMRDKLQKQKFRKLPESDLYTTYTNLGTLLVHANLTAATSGDQQAYERLNEGKEFLKEAVKANGRSIFDRDQWYLHFVHFLISSIKDPSWLKTMTCIGSDLNHRIESPVSNHENSWELMTHGATPSFDIGLLHASRKYLTSVGCFSSDLTSRSHAHFDEPVMALIWMWRNGEGDNPHIAMCLGQIMARVGQRFIAWCCFERAIQLSESFSPDPMMQQHFIRHCSRAQKFLESSHHDTRRKIELPAFDGADLRRQFQAELAYGRKYQANYQKYEENMIATGTDIDRDDFYSQFEISNPSPVTKSGPEDKLEYRRYSGNHKKIPDETVEWVVLFVGFTLFVHGLLVFVCKRLQSKPPADAPV